MKFRRLGKTNLRVSVIGLGTYQFGGSWGTEFRNKDVAEIMATARDHGINFLDTAECYGVNHLSETLVGHALTSSRDAWIIATKFGHHRYEKTKNMQAWGAVEVQQQLEESLRALQTDYIDVYQFHSGSNEAFDNDELWTMLDKQITAGKIRYLGLSVSRKHSQWREYQSQHASRVGASAIQVKYNRLEKDAEHEVFPACIAQDLGVIARVPLASGLLSGKYQDLTAFDSADARAKKYDAHTISRMQQEIEDIIRHELPDNATLTEYALAWSLSHAAVSCVIPGCKTAEHVIQNAAAADLAIVQAKHPMDMPE